MAHRRQIPSESDIPMHGWRPYDDFHRERIRAHAKHDANGPSMERKPWDHPIWLAVLVEEVGEVARVLNDEQLGLFDHEEARRKLRTELVQTGAMVAAWIDALEQGERLMGETFVIIGADQYHRLPFLGFSSAKDPRFRGPERSRCGLIRGAVVSIEEARTIRRRSGSGLLHECLQGACWGNGGSD